MGRLQRPHVIEAALWFAIVAIFYIFSFAFNQTIEIYKFGATAWPRGILLMLLLASLGNLYFQYRNGSSAQHGQIGVTDLTETSAPRDWHGRLRLVAVLFTPFLFALLLKPVGIYVAAPFFIAAIIWLFGEHRWRAILGTTALIYVIFIGLFLVMLNAPLPQGNVSPFYDVSAWILKMKTKLQGLL